VQAERFKYILLFYEKMIHIVNQPSLSEIISELKYDILRIANEQESKKYENVHSVIPDLEYKTFNLYSHKFNSFPSNFLQTIALIYFHKKTTEPYNEETEELIAQSTRNKQLSDNHKNPFDVNPIGIIVPSH